MAEKNSKKAASTASAPAKEEVVTINLQPFLMPGSIFLSAVLISLSLLIGLNNIGLALKGGSVQGTTTTDTTNTDTTNTDTTTGTTAVTLDQIKSLFTDGKQIAFGDANRKVLFVEFSDPSCPYCHIAAGKNSDLNTQAGDRFKLVADGGTYQAPVEEMKKLVDEGKASFAWVYTNGHGSGEMGTKAFYCGYEKGKFWEVHDLLMSASGYDLLNNQIKNDTTQSQKLADFLSSAVSASDMKSCLDSGKYDSKLTEGATIATSFGVQGTPGFFVNTTNYPGAYGYADMKSTVEAALQ